MDVASLARKNDSPIPSNDGLRRGVIGGDCGLPALATSRLFASTGPRLGVFFSGIPLLPTVDLVLVLSAVLGPCFRGINGARVTGAVGVDFVLSSFGRRTTDRGVTLAAAVLAEGVGVLLGVVVCTRFDMDFAAAKRGRVVLGGVACAASLGVGDDLDGTL